MELRMMNEKNIDRIVDLWNINLPSEFAATKKMIQEKIYDDKDVFWEGSFELVIDGQIKGFVVSKTNNSELEEYENCAWISVLLVDSDIQNCGYGRMLLARAEEALTGMGIKKIILGGEFNNFFSGIPAPTPAKTNFFQNKKYTVNHEDHYDLMADVSKIDFDRLNIKMDNSDAYQTVVYKEEYHEKLINFFDNSFPGRWKYEIVNGTFQPHELLLLLHQDKVIGFCKVFKSEGVTDHTAFYGENYGSLGPIGISQEYRGKGVGNRILNDSFKILQARGTRNVLIDWTILKDFYGQFGFIPLRTYRGAYKII